MKKKKKLLEKGGNLLRKVSKEHRTSWPVEAK